MEGTIHTLESRAHFFSNNAELIINQPNSFLSANQNTFCFDYNFYLFCLPQMWYECQMIFNLVVLDDQIGNAFFLITPKGFNFAKWK